MEVNALKMFNKGDLKSPTSLSFDFKVFSFLMPELDTVMVYKV